MAVEVTVSTNLSKSKPQGIPVKDSRGLLLFIMSSNLCLSPRVETEGEKKEIWRLTLVNASAGISEEEKDREHRMYRDVSGLSLSHTHTYIHTYTQAGLPQYVLCSFYLFSCFLIYKIDR